MITSFEILIIVSTIIGFLFFLVMLIKFPEVRKKTIANKNFWKIIGMILIAPLALLHYLIQKLKQQSLKNKKVTLIVLLLIVTVIIAIVMREPVITLLIVTGIIVAVIYFFSAKLTQTGIQNRKTKIILAILLTITVIIILLVVLKKIPLSVISEMPHLLNQLTKPSTIIIILVPIILILVIISLRKKPNETDDAYNKRKRRTIRIVLLGGLAAATILSIFVLKIQLEIALIAGGALFILLGISWYIADKRRRQGIQITLREGMKFWGLKIAILGLILTIIAIIGIILWRTKVLPAHIVLKGSIIAAAIAIAISIISWIPKFGPWVLKFTIVIAGGFAGFWIISLIRPPPAITVIFLIAYLIMFPLVLGKGGWVLFLIGLISISFVVVKSDPTRTQNMFTDLKTGLGDIGGWFKLQWQKMTRSVERTQAGLSGEYFEGEVQEASTKKLGVFIDEFRSIAKEFTEGEPIIIYSKIRAETLSDKPIKIKIDCLLDKKRGEVIPESEFEVEKFETKNIDCRFGGNKQKIPAGGYKAKLKAGFNFETNAFIKIYFMDRDNLKELRSQNIDLVKQFGIDEHPKATYTAGPIMIGVDVGRMPLGISEEVGFGPTIGIMLENMWNGNIKLLKNLTVNTPGGIKQINLYPGEILPEKCLGCEKGSEECECTYDLSKLKELKDKNVIPLRIYTKINDPEMLIGTGPINYKSVKIRLNYDYAIEEEMGIRVRPKQKNG